jgi:hypothetical protein
MVFIIAKKNYKRAAEKNVKYFYSPRILSRDPVPLKRNTVKRFYLPPTVFERPWPLLSVGGRVGFPKITAEGPG